MGADERLIAECLAEVDDMLEDDHVGLWRVWRCVERRVGPNQERVRSTVLSLLTQLFARGDVEAGWPDGRTLAVSELTHDELVSEVSQMTHPPEMDDFWLSYGPFDPPRPH